jgi:ABC-type transport system, involved in lipoprotein release, permease component
LRAELFVAKKYVFSSKSTVLSVFALLSVLAIGLGVAILIIVTGIMNGFQSELKRRLLVLQPHLYITNIFEPTFKDADSVANYISKKLKIKAYPALIAKVIVKSGEGIDGVVLRAQDLNHLEGELNLLYGSFGDGVLVGENFMSQMGLDVNSSMEIMVFQSSPFGPTLVPKRVKVSGVYSTGLYVYDAQTVLTDIKLARKLFNLGEREAGVIFAYADDPYKADELCKKIYDLGFGCSSWITVNRTLFAALNMERFAMFISFALILLIAAINVVVSITMLTLEKRWEIGLLKSLGFTSWQITTIFTLVGTFLGLGGLVLGSCGGWALAYFVDKYKLVKLPPDVYMIDYVPIKPQLTDWFVIALLTVFISYLAAFIPSYLSARLKPVDALRRVV